MKIKIIDLNKNYQIIKSGINKKLKSLFKKQTFILGKEVENLEKNLSNFLNVKYSLGVSSGTDALIVALMACGIKKNDEVIIPNITWISTASSVVLLGAKPVIVDVNTSDGLIDTNSLNKKINNKTKAIISVVIRFFARFRETKKIAKKNKLYLINDGAQSLDQNIKIIIVINIPQ